MGMSKNLGMYADIHAIFEGVVENGPATLTFDTKSQRTTFRSRAYYYRKLLHDKQAAESLVSIAATHTPFDKIVIRDHPSEKDKPKADHRKLRVEECVIKAQVSFDSGAELDLAKTYAEMELSPEDAAALDAEAFVAGLLKDE